MKTLNEALKGTKEEIELEIQERHELISQMVGTLYPQVVLDEVYKLNMKLRDLKYE